MLSQEESGRVFEMLKSQEKPVEEIVSDLISTFPRHRHFSACDDEVEKFERAFLLQLLSSSSSNSNKEFLKQSAADYIKGFDPSSHAFPQREQLQQQYCDKVHPEPFNSAYINASTKNAFPDPDLPHGCDPNSPEFDFQPGAKTKLGAGSRDETVTGLLTHLSLKGLDPRWIRPLPPRFPVLDRELEWLIPDNNHELLWDHGMCADTSRGAAVRDLIAKALKGPLLPAQYEQVVVELANDPKLVYHCGLTPRKLPELVENNPLIAVDVLTKLINSPEISEYYTVLVNMDMSLHSMEVVNRLTTAVELPKEFVRIHQPPVAIATVFLPTASQDSRQLPTGSRDTLASLSSS
ncbi:CCR4-NOT transcription complex subunit 11 [Citrus sinensis]|nr:CCR4-NOT transcription complex subunit 11 [Citrus sinensis]